jgi:DNA-binding NarL/FixJ family response regulator
MEAQGENPSPGIRVRLLLSDGLLRHALRARLGPAGFAVCDEGECADGAPRGALLLATTSDLPSDRCAELVGAGAQVVMLAAVPRESERRRFLEAGAVAYVPMSADGEELVRRLRVAAEHELAAVCC